ncbi:MAG: hypothetical protein ACREMZ_17045, partial [Gemmatimonadales bacterium]
MVSLPQFPSTDSGGQQRARARLVAMRAAPAAPPGQVNAGPADQDPADPYRAEPDPVDAPPVDVSPAPPREGRLVRRWVPGPLRDARWEPGRPGALMLSLVAALAAVLAAVGVWRDRPVPLPAPSLPLVAPAGTADPAGAAIPAV